MSVAVCVAVLQFHETRYRGLKQVEQALLGQPPKWYFYVKLLPFSPLSCPRSEDPAEHRKKICCAREFKCSTRAVTDSNAHSARRASTCTTSASLYVWGSGA